MSMQSVATANASITDTAVAPSGARYVLSKDPQRSNNVFIGGAAVLLHRVSLIVTDGTAGIKVLQQPRSITGEIVAATPTVRANGKQLLRQGDGALTSRGHAIWKQGNIDTTDPVEVRSRIEDAGQTTVFADGS